MLIFQCTDSFATENAVPAFAVSYGEGIGKQSWARGERGIGAGPTSSLVPFLMLLWVSNSSAAN